MERDSEVSAIAEISILHEILLLRFSDSKENFAEAIIEKATRLFGVRRLALLLGEGSAQQLIASLAFRNEKEILDKIDQNKPNYFKFDFVNNGKFGTLFMEQAHPIGARERRLYIIFARQLGNALIVAEEAAGRKQAEEELAKFKTIADVAPYGVEIADLEGKMTYVNETFARMHGYTPGEIVGQHLSISYTEEQLEAFTKLRNRCLETGSFVGEEMWRKRKDGSVFVSSMSMQIVKDEKGNPLYLSAVVIDITERKQAEAALRESEERYHALVDAGAHMGEAIFILQDTDKVEAAHPFANEEWARITGYTTEELRGISLYDVIHPRHRAAVAGRARRRLQQGQDVPGRWEISVITKDGTEVPIEVFGGGAITYHGRLATVGYARDITERKRMEHALNERVKELQCLYDIAYIVERPGITLNELCQGVANLLPAGWRYPEITCARITLGDKEFRTGNFRTTEWKQSANINVKG